MVEAQLTVTSSIKTGLLTWLNLREFASRTLDSCVK